MNLYVSVFKILWSPILVPQFQISWLLLLNKTEMAARSPSPSFSLLCTSLTAQSSCAFKHVKLIAFIDSPLNTQCTLCFQKLYWKLTFIPFQVILYFYYQHSTSSWNQTGTLHWKGILILVSVLLAQLITNTNTLLTLLHHAFLVISVTKLAASHLLVGLSSCLQQNFIFGKRYKFTHNWKHVKPNPVSSTPSMWDQYILN